MIPAISDCARSVRPDRPQGHELTIVPILGPSHDQPPYRLLDSDTLPFVKVQEVSASGQVPTLTVENSLDTRVFLIDGQELIGAKQNRILNTDVMVPAARSITIPVSCVEHGRWHSVSESFAPGRSAPHRTRCRKVSRVHESLRARQAFDAGQEEVWAEVACCISGSGGHSQTQALAAAYAARNAELADFRKNLRLPAEAVGLAAFHRRKLCGIDIFDRPATLAYFFNALIDSYAVDLLGQAPDVRDQPAPEQTAAIEQALACAASAEWEAFQSPGEGADYRLKLPELAGAALVWEGRSVIHLQLFPQSQAQAEPAPSLHTRIFRNRRRE